MQTQTLKIEIPKGFEVDTFDKATGELRLKSKPMKVTDRITSLLDAIAELGEEATEVVTYRALLKVLPPTHYVVSQQAIVVITKALNEGWIPDWSNSNELKYIPYFEMRGSSGFRFHGYVRWLSFSCVGSRLCFKTRELAEHAGKYFIDTYRDFMVIE
jgi:hypothetical protein